MNLLLADSSPEGFFRTLLAVTQGTAYAALTVAFVLGLLSLRLRSLPELRCVEYQRRTIQWIRAGFLLLTLAQIAHCTWTTFAWGESWVWDPAKSLGLLAWMTYAGVLHMHHVPTLKGRKAMLASLGGWVFLVAMNATVAALNMGSNAKS